MKFKINFYSLVCKNNPETIVAIGFTSVPIEVELTCYATVIVIATSIEPRVRRVNEVRIVAISQVIKKQKSEFLQSMTYNIILCYIKFLINYKQKLVTPLKKKSGVTIQKQQS